MPEGAAFDSLTFRSHYWSDPEARVAFRRFLDTIHHLDLSLWEQQGYWDEQLYSPFSLFAGERIVASACLYTMEMVVDGQPRRLGQFSGVGTLPEYRRRGLNTLLTQKALAWARPTHDGFFLFADEEAVPFYRRCGFRPAPESLPILSIDRPGPDPAPSHHLRKLDPEEEADRALVFRLASERSPISMILGVRNPKLLMFHFLYTLRDCAYYIEDLDLVAFFRTGGGVLTLFDIVGRRVPSWAELHPYLAEEPHREVRFYFMPDQLGVTATRHAALTDNHTHVLPPCEPPVASFVFPYTAHA